MGAPKLQSDLEPNTASPQTTPQPYLSTWQDRLLPLMRAVLISFTVFFFATTLYQAYVLQNRIYKLGHEELKLPSAATSPGTSDPAVSLEVYAIRQRYQHNAIILASRSWIIYLGFITGMILAMVGATFVLGKIQEPSSELVAKGSGAELSFKSASPGLILAVLGTALMISTMAFRADMSVSDVPLYFRGTVLPATERNSQGSQPEALPSKSAAKQPKPGASTKDLDTIDKALKEQNKQK